MKKALLVATNSALSNNPGGIQYCLKEYILAIEAAGLSLEYVNFNHQSKIKDRINRKIFGIQAYDFGIPDDVYATVLNKCKEQNIKYVFAYLSENSKFSPFLRNELPKETQLISLSFGLESVDNLHTIRMKETRKKRDLSKLANQLLIETQTRSSYDHVFTLAPFEVEIERWLGAKNPCWLPQRLMNKKIDWQPVKNRIGIVATLDHPPNIEGLKLFLNELATREHNINLRLVGGPSHLGDWYTKNFSFVEYLGPLSDANLIKEATTWTCFPQPLFCYSRGATTKLATGMNWMIPVITTTSGMRGYQWHEGGPVIADNVADFVSKTILLSNDLHVSREAKVNVEKAVNSSCSVEDRAKIIIKQLHL